MYHPDPSSPEFNLRRALGQMTNRDNGVLFMRFLHPEDFSSALHALRDLPARIMVMIVLVWLALMSVSVSAPANTGSVQPVGALTDIDRLQLLGQLGGSYTAVAVQGEYLFVGIGQRLFSYSIENPEHPLLLGQTASLQGRIQQIICDGSYAYVAIEGGLHIFRIDDPVNLTATTSYDIVGSVQDLAKSGSLLAMSDGYRGFYLLDVADPSSPRLLSHQDITDQPGQVDVAGIDIAGQRLAVVDGLGLHILDITDPHNPVKLTFFKTQGYASDVVLSAPFAFVADGSQFQIIDLTSMENPVLLASLPMVGDVSRLKLRGHLVYLANGTGGVAIVDVRDPSNPRLISKVNTPGSAIDLTLTEGYAYVAADANALQIINTSQPDQATIVGMSGLAANAGGIFVDQNHAFIADGFGLRIIDVSDVTRPYLDAFISTPGQARDVTVEGNYAYVADGFQGVRLIDVSNKQAPVEIADFDTPGYAGDIVILNGYGYIADGMAGLQIVALTQNSIQPIGSYNSPGYAEAVALWRQYALLADGQGGLQILDVSNPVSPQLVSTMNADPYAQGVTAIGNDAFVANAYGETISRIDISDPANPQSVETLAVPGYAYDVYVNRDVAFMPVELKGMQMVDVRTHGHSFAAGGYGTGGKVRRVVMRDNTLFILNVDGGLTILKYNAPLYTFLPYQEFPPRPQSLSTPLLYPVINIDDRGEYVVRWSLVSRATEYSLEEATNLRFDDAQSIYRGPGSSAHISNKGAGRYYYRVRALSPVGESNWSEARSADVLWEREPNDEGKTEANGPLVLGLTYHGTFEETGDIKDYYYFNLDRPQSITVSLVNPSSRDYDLALRMSDLKLVSHSAQIGAGRDEVIITSVLPIGRYLVQVYNPKLNSSPLAYILRIQGRN